MCRFPNLHKTVQEQPPETSLRQGPATTSTKYTCNVNTENAFENIYWSSSWTSICNLFRTFFDKVSQSVPLPPQAWAGPPKSHQTRAHGSQNTAPGWSKWHARVSKCSPRVFRNIIQKQQPGKCNLIGRTVLERTPKGVQIQTASLKNMLRESQGVNLICRTI